jgi:hypothetical protein
MKNLICITFILLFFACKKEKQDDNNSPSLFVDYRDAYIGTYNSTKLCFYWDMNHPTPDTTFFGAVSLSVIKHPTVSNLIIVGPDTISIDTSGTYSGFYNPPGYHYYTASFRNDSIYVSNSVGGLGGGTNCSIIGKK